MIFCLFFLNKEHRAPLTLFTFREGILEIDRNNGCSNGLDGDQRFQQMQRQHVMPSDGSIEIAMAIKRTNPWWW